SSIKSVVDPNLRQAGARAILRHSLHMSDHRKVKMHNSLNPLFIDLYNRGELKGEELIERRRVIKDSCEDVLDA
ncbi:hypothetical protein DXG01_001398, partial [Tephrocybe rancida]